MIAKQDPLQDVMNERESMKMALMKIMFAVYPPINHVVFKLSIRRLAQHSICDWSCRRKVSVRR